MLMDLMDNQPLGGSLFGLGPFRGGHAEGNRNLMFFKTLVAP